MTRILGLRWFLIMTVGTTVSVEKCWKIDFCKFCEKEIRPLWLQDVRHEMRSLCITYVFAFI